MRENKYRFLFNIAVVIAVFIYFFGKLQSITEGVAETRFHFEVPHVPNLQFYVSLKEIPSEETLLLNKVWGLEFSGKVGQDNITLSGFIYKKFNGLDSICLYNDCSYRWEFYGTSFSNGSYSALFFNPKLSLIKVVKPGDSLDKNLVVVNVNNDNVEVKFSYKNKIKTFNLKIFNVNPGLYRGGKKK